MILPSTEENQKSTRRIKRNIQTTILKLKCDSARVQTANQFRASGGQVVGGR